MSAPQRSLPMYGNPPRSFVHRAATSRDVERLNAVGYLPVLFRSLADDPRLHVDGVSRGRLNLWRTRSEQGFQTLSKGAPDFVSVRVVLSGRMLRRDRGGDYAVGPAQALILPFDGMRDLRAAAAVDTLGCSFTMETFRDVQAAFDGSGAAGFDFEPLIELKTPALRFFAHLLQRTLEAMSCDLHDRDLIFPLLEEALIGQIVAAWPRRSGSEPPTVGQMSVRRILAAADYIEANLSRPIYVGDVARAVGLNVRALQANFRREMGETLVRYIVGRRLDRVRMDLLGDTSLLTVAQGAHRWGFVNISDFSRRYRERFGELPSDTLRRGRGGRFGAVLAGMESGIGH